jgi:hypothetical protein
VRKLTLLALGAAATAGVVAYLRRGNDGSGGTETWSEPAPASPPTSESTRAEAATLVGPAPTIVSQPEAEVEEVPVDPDSSEPAPGPASREAESEATEDTKLEREVEQEREARHEAAARLRDDPTHARLDSDDESAEPAG